jgi:hypothetical protein
MCVQHSRIVKYLWWRQVADPRQGRFHGPANNRNEEYQRNVDPNTTHGPQHIIDGENRE